MIFSLCTDLNAKSYGREVIGNEDILSYCLNLVSSGQERRLVLNLWHPLCNSQY